MRKSAGAGTRGDAPNNALNGATRWWILLLALGACLAGLSAFAQEAADRKPEGVILTLNGPVTPANAGYLAREIENADAADRELVIIEIDTPGGLVDSMKTVIKAILASETPVATFVSPQGARSASAGLYILYAAHVSAMAPSTNTGAATPVEIGGGSPSRDNPFEDENPFDASEEKTSENKDDEEKAGEEKNGDDDGAAAQFENTADDGLTQEDGQKDADKSESKSPALGNEDALRAKIINDSVAYIRALAEERGRNADWAESAVRDAVSITSREALQLGVIDIVADDLDDLLTQIDGRSVKTAGGERVLQTADLKLTRAEPTPVERVLNFISNPNVAVILMSLATTGIIIEMWNPGSIFPGVVGLTCLIFGLYAFQVLPFNWLGAAFMGVGLVLMTIEAFTPTFGLAGLSGLVVFAGGMYTVFPEQFRVSTTLIGAVVATVGAFLGLILIALVGSRSHGPLIGAEAIRRREGVVDEWDGKEGWVLVEGERWRARADKPLSPGDRIRVLEVDGLVLVVKQAKGGGLLGGLAPSEA